MKQKLLPLLFNVKFTAAEAGWLDFEISCGNQFFYDHFSHCYDPILELKDWLEELSSGVSEATFEYDNESIIIGFHVKQQDSQNDIFTIFYYDEPLPFQVIVNRKQLVKSFYLGLLNFAYSQKYIPEMWETPFIKDLLMEHFSKNESQLLKHLLELPSIELSKLLNAADEYDYLTAELELSKTQDFYYNFPDNYDSFSLEQKSVCLQDMINDEISNGYDGTSLKSIQSDIIDKYLSIYPKDTIMQGHYYFHKWIYLDNSGKYCVNHLEKPSSINRPFKNLYWNNFEKGIYVDSSTGDPLFTSLNKLDDGSGWPCFYDPIENRMLDYQREENQGVKVFSHYTKRYLGYIVFNQNNTNTIEQNYCYHDYYRIVEDILLFIPLEKMAKAGYSHFVPYLMEN